MKIYEIAEAVGYPNYKRFCEVFKQVTTLTPTEYAAIQRTKQLGLVSIPGAMTPTEIIAAHNCGADLVKLFPAATLGVRYIKDILAPISHVKLLATAGITEENFKQFLELGLAGAGISGRLTDKKLIAEKDWTEFTRRAQVFVQIDASV